jgi:hypothetical protein
LHTPVFRIIGEISRGEFHFQETPDILCEESERFNIKKDMKAIPS